tara:strand:+ start:6100 stop:6711 length:612 start_codon:yes stop_codon:yes gene_type:complete
MTKFIEIPASKKSISLRRPIFGVGINDADYFVRIKVNGKTISCPYYVKWSSMLNRCYYDKENARHPSYIGCTVTKDWLTFSKFKSWMKSQKWQGLQLDKDLLVQGNRVYSPETCLFVTSAINTLLLDRKDDRGKYPQGVSFKRLNNKFVAQISINGTRKHLGLFPTLEEASEEYKTAKYALIKQLALQQADPLKSALLAYKIP